MELSLEGLGFNVKAGSSMLVFGYGLEGGWVGVK